MVTGQSETLGGQIGLGSSATGRNAINVTANVLKTNSRNISHFLGPDQKGEV